MTRLVAACVEQWRVVLLTLGFIILMGIAAYQIIPKESSPDIKIPFIYVSMTLEGVSPEDAERLMIRPLEKRLDAVEGVKEMSAQAVEGLASVSLEFEAGFDSSKALQDVRAAVDEARPELPESMDEPKVIEFSFSKFPILTVILTGPVEERQLVRLARDLRDKIEQIGMVLEAQLSGDREEMLEILIDPLVLESYSIDPTDVFTRVRNNNTLVPAGNLDTGQGRFALKLPGLIETARDIRRVPLKVDGEAVTTLEDVADIRRSFKDVLTVARVNDKSAIGIAVSKRPGANIIETVQAVKELVAEEQRQWPPGVAVIFSNDQSTDIRDMLRDLNNNIVLATILVLVVTVVAIGLRSSILVAISIPGAFCFTILCIWLAGGTLNIVVLFSLILSIGIMVDAATVVAEYADRLMLDGKKPRDAYIQAASRMAWPVISTSLVTAVVFLPLLFWPGIVGEFMKFMPLTLILTLIGGLLMAMVFIPVIGALFGRAAGVSEERRRALLAAEHGDLRDLGSFTGSYIRLLQRCLRRPLLTIAAMLGAMGVIIAAFVALGKGVEFFPEIEPRNIMVYLRVQGNLAVEEKDALAAQVEDRIRALDDIRVRFTTVGELSNRQEDTTEDRIAELNLELRDWQERRTANEVLADIRERVAGIPGLLVETAKQEDGPPVGKPIQIEFSSRVPEKLDAAVAATVEAMERIGGFENITDERPIPEIEWEITVNRELAGRYDIDVARIGQVVKMVSNGIIVDTYRPDEADDEVDIVVRFPEQYRNLSQLDRLRVYTAEGQVPISHYIERRAEQTIGTIRRVDGKRVMHVRADVAPGIVADQKLREIQAWMQSQPVDPDIQVRFRGEDEEQAEASQFLSMAFLIALFLMAMILVVQFNSIYRMVVIMSAVFFSTVGILLGLLVTAEPFGIVMCGVAVISLAGVVVNTNIIFIDTYAILRREGVAMGEALLRSGAQRLRPILLTQITTVLGLLPMVYQVNIDFLSLDITLGAPSSQWWVQLSTAIAGGLTFATVLTLFFTPCLLVLEERFPNWVRRRLGRRAVTA